MSRAAKRRSRSKQTTSTKASTLAITPLRLVVGGLFMGHGLQKLRGWFGGGGLEGTAEMMEHVGLVPPKPAAVAAGVTETAGGALMATGYHTPMAAAMITGVMSTAIDKVHAPHGLWVTNGGYEYNLVLIASAAAIAGVGPGPISLDARRGRYRTGLGWCIAAVAAGLAGSRLVARLAEVQRETDEAIDANFGLPEPAMEHAQRLSAEREMEHSQRLSA